MLARACVRRARGDNTYCANADADAGCVTYNKTTDTLQPRCACPPPLLLCRKHVRLFGGISVRLALAVGANEQPARAHCAGCWHWQLSGGICAGSGGQYQRNGQVVWVQRNPGYPCVLPEKWS